MSMELNQTLTLGAYVTDARGREGYITSFEHSSEQEQDWLDAQRYLTETDKQCQRWVSVLVNGGGSICLPETKVKQAPPPARFINSWASFFGLPGGQE